MNVKNTFSADLLQLCNLAMILKHRLPEEESQDFCTSRLL